MEILIKVSQHTDVLAVGISGGRLSESPHGKTPTCGRATADALFAMPLLKAWWMRRVTPHYEEKGWGCDARGYLHPPPVLERI